ncbi:hypothetical protein P2G88_14405 [Aliiglaciecola sp. CAU 1673]|uniref:hypothetical protein n=1 Tax=Aliiglaciecola sp. CAU 1673 TaxID=3032595 RepID=UPI0023D99003|nr:hypothetical protein [Aliiglaciecola sp. CAU 1673]MDF2179443.1 hypothetical protein [Aliiglaciecola sp. CAU 1673]
MTASHQPTRHCVACGAEIPVTAAICRYCHSEQSPGLGKRVATWLKWIGGAVTVLSLLVGAWTLSGLYLDWQERNAAVNELQQAADWLQEAKDYPRAWRLYDQALALNPSAAGIRNKQFEMARIWVRDFQLPEHEADKLSNQLVEVLYRGLPALDIHEQATTLAHIARLGQIRRLNQIAEQMDIAAVYQRALSLDKDNVFANAFYGAWLLEQRSLSVEAIENGANHLRKALGKSDDSYLRELQLWRLTLAVERGNHAVREAAIKALIPALWQAREAGFVASEDLRYRVLEKYGDNLRFSLLEAALSAIGAKQHLQLLDWLSEGLSGSGSYGDRLSARNQFLRARMLEAAEEPGKAAEIYQALLSIELGGATSRFAKRVDEGLYRTTGQWPARALARNYRDDPLPEHDLWDFHLDTLAHFDPTIIPENLEQALAFFNAAFKSKEAVATSQLNALLAIMPEAIARMEEDIAIGDERERTDSYTSGFSALDHTNARYNKSQLILLWARAHYAAKHWDPAAALLKDELRHSEGYQRAWFDGGWEAVRAELHFVLAKTLTQRAKQTNSAEDRRNAIMHLQAATQTPLFKRFASWEVIKGSDFSALRAEPAYQDLVRGH